MRGRKAAETVAVTTAVAGAAVEVVAPKISAIDIAGAWIYPGAGRKKAAPESGF
ncbi:MAG: hypothetical protein IOC31_30985 [Burkholderia sp.]|jgi:hypothetical protein|nr:hypothetical protein [Burkholderia sp.]MCA3858896.1 hypothetical protein [Burkholderia sp.]